MNLARKAGLVAGPVMAVLVLAGCNTGNSSASASPQGSGSAAPASSAASSPASAPAAPATPTATASASASSASAASDTCSAAELTASEGLGGGPGAMSNGDAVENILLNSKVSTPCVMQGYPGVDVIGNNEDTGQQGERLSLPRASGDTSQKVTSDAQFELEYMPGGKSVPTIDVTELIITPPNAYDQITYKLKSPLAIKLSNSQIDAAISPVGDEGTNTP